MLDGQNVFGQSTSCAGGGGEEPANTGISGSSLGGLLSLYAACARSATFGRIAAISPSLSWAENRVVAFTSANEKPPIRLYIDMGSLENGSTRAGDGNGVDDSIDLLRKMKRIALAEGLIEGQSLLVVEDEGANHHESFWADRFPGALRFLLPPK